MAEEKTITNVMIYDLMKDFKSNSMNQIKIRNPKMGHGSSQIFTDKLFQVRLAAEEAMQQSLRV